MSYDLTFFKYEKKPRMAAVKMYEALMDGKEVPGLESLPVEDIRKAILESFSDWKINGEKPLDLEREDASFQVTFDPSFIRTDWYGKYFQAYVPQLRQMLGNRFGLHMYDAQMDVLREVIDGKTALDRQSEIRVLFAKKFGEIGYKKHPGSFCVFDRETDDSVLTVRLSVYEQNRSDELTVRPDFMLRYPRLDDLAYEIRGKDPRGSSKGPTATFAITDASNKAIKDPFYTLKNGAYPAVVAERVMKDIEDYVFPIFAKADSIQKYEEIFLDKSVKSVRPNVAYREYFLMAMALLNRGTIDEKTLARLLAKTEKNDTEFDPSCANRVRAWIAENRG